MFILTELDSLRLKGVTNGMLSEPEVQKLRHVYAYSRQFDISMKCPTHAQAWQQQRALDSCPFGTDRRMFGGSWQYRTSSLIKAEPVVSVHIRSVTFTNKGKLVLYVGLRMDQLQMTQDARLFV